MAPQIDDSILTSGARGAWKLLVLIASILSATAIVIGVIAAIARFEAAQAMSDLNAWVQQHQKDVAAGRAMMEEYVRDDRAFKLSIAENQYEMCARMPGAKCKPVIVETPQFPPRPR